MIIDKAFIDAHLEGLEECVKDASNAILKVYESSDFGEINKKDGSPLTIADRNANEIILNRLNLLTPDIPIISEETFEVESLDSLCETYWLVDPLDGTKEFINKTGEFTVNIALINDRSTVFGIVAAPVSGKIWHGSVLDKQHEVDSVPETIRIVMSKSHKNENDEKFLEFLDMNNVQYQTVEKGSSLKLCSLADNEADIYSRFGPTSEWDIAAADAVLSFYGGSIFSLENFERLNYSKKNILNPPFIAYSNEIIRKAYSQKVEEYAKKLL